MTSLEIWEDIQSKGFFKTDGRHVDPDMRHPYQWLSKQLASRVSPPPKGIRYPVWAWYSWEGKRRPDLRTYRDEAPGIMLELDIPDNEVLLSDYHK